MYRNPGVGGVQNRSDSIDSTLAGIAQIQVQVLQKTNGGGVTGASQFMRQLQSLAHEIAETDKPDDGSGGTSYGDAHNDGRSVGDDDEGIDTSYDDPPRNPHHNMLDVIDGLASLQSGDENGTSTGGCGRSRGTGGVGPSDTHDEDQDMDVSGDDADMDDGGQAIGDGFDDEGMDMSHDDAIAGGQPTATQLTGDYIAAGQFDTSQSGAAQQTPRQSPTIQPTAGSSAPSSGSDLPSAGTRSLDPSGNNLVRFVENNPSSKPITIQWEPNAGSGKAQTFTIPPGQSVTFTFGTNGKTVGGAMIKDKMRHEFAVNANDPNHVTVAANLSSIVGMGSEATMTDNQGVSFNTGGIIKKAIADVAAGKAPADILTKDANGKTQLVGYYDGSTQAQRDVAKWQQAQTVNGKPFAGQSYVTPISDGSRIGPGDSSKAHVAGYNPMIMGASTSRHISMSFY